MEAHILNADISSTCAPLCLNSDPALLKIAGQSLRDHQIAAIRTLGTLNSPITFHGAAWLVANDLESLLKATLAGGHHTLIDPDSGIGLAWTDISESPHIESQYHHASAGSFAIRYPWDFLHANELAVAALSESQILGEISPAAHLSGTIRIGQGTHILPGVVIEGKVIIGDNCKIGPNCYLRGNTSIGNNCHIGNAVEIKNSLVGDNSNVGHLSYVGDSILGNHVNLGAGTIISNLRHDGGNHHSLVKGKRIDTGRRKFGAIIGDGVHTGINTSLYPGRKLWPNTSTLPGAIVSKDINTD